LHDANATAYRDLALHVRTKIQTGQITANADNIATNTDALVLVNNGTGKAINATGSVAISADITAANITLSNNLTIANDLAIGNNLSIGGDLVVASDISVTGSINATDIAGVLVSMVLRSQTGGTQVGGATYVLDSGASATTDFYKGAILVILTGSGQYQSREIVSYNGTSKVCTVSAWATPVTGTTTYMIMPGASAWLSSPGVELAAMPTKTSTYGQLLQFVFQRFAYARRQESETHTVYKEAGNADADTGALASADFKDETTYQYIGKLSDV